jgi:hypothetical protein
MRNPPMACYAYTLLLTSIYLNLRQQVLNESLSLSTGFFSHEDSAVVSVELNKDFEASIHANTASPQTQITYNVRKVVF